MAGTWFGKNGQPFRDGNQLKGCCCLPDCAYSTSRPGAVDWRQFRDDKTAQTGCADFRNGSGVQGYTFHAYFGENTGGQNSVSIATVPAVWFNEVKKL